MTPIVSLWLPIIVSTVFAFIASSLIHMVLPWHKGDYPQLPNQDAIMDALRPFNLAPGDYMLPRPGEHGGDEDAGVQGEGRARSGADHDRVQGHDGQHGEAARPVVHLSAGGGVFAAHIAGTLVGPGGDGKLIFHSAFIVAFAGYVLALWQLTIWYRRSMRITLTSTFDGIIYSTIVGLTFVWLWPHSNYAGSGKREAPREVNTARGVYAPFTQSRGASRFPLPVL